MVPFQRLLESQYGFRSKLYTSSVAKNQMWFHFAFSWCFFLFKRNVWRTNNLENRNASCFTLSKHVHWTYLPQVCHKYSFSKVLQVVQSDSKSTFLNLTHFQWFEIKSAHILTFLPICLPKSGQRSLNDWVCLNMVVIWMHCDYFDPVFISFSTRESLCSQPTYLDGWRISAHAGSICCWAMAVSDQVQADTRPTAFQHSRGTLCPPPQPPSLQGATSPKPPSQTSTSATSTGP